MKLFIHKLAMEEKKNMQNLFDNREERTFYLPYSNKKSLKISFHLLTVFLSISYFRKVIKGIKIQQNRSARFREFLNLKYVVK